MTKSILTLSIVAMLSIPFAARATLVFGTVNFSGSANIVTGDINFIPPTYNIVGTQEGGFVPFEGSTGTIFDITNPPDTVNTPLDQLFMTFNFDPGLTITMTDLLGGQYTDADCHIAAAVGETCTPGPPDDGNPSPYSLVDTETGSSNHIDFLGFESDGTSTTPIIGSLTETSTMSYQAILGLVEGGAPGFNADFAGVITVNPSPEPSTLLELVMGFGLVGIGLVYRKKLKRA